MSEPVIYAIERIEKPNRARKEGFIPGVVYGRDLDSKSIKLEQKELKRLLQGHAKNTKISVKIGNDTKQCILKEIQKDPITGQILHVELQTIHNEDMIRLKVPVIFHGKEKLAGRQLVLQEYIYEIEAVGKAAIIPEFFSIDIGERKSGDKITIKDIQIDSDIKVLDNESEILAVISPTKGHSEES